MVKKSYATTCKHCKKEFVYQRRVQTKGKFAGNWWGRARLTCGSTCPAPVEWRRVKQSARRAAESDANEIKKLDVGVQSINEGVNRSSLTYKTIEDSFKLVGVPMRESYKKRGNNKKAFTLSKIGFIALHDAIEAIVLPNEDDDSLLWEIIALVEDYNARGKSTISLKISDV